MEREEGSDELGWHSSDDGRGRRVGGEVCSWDDQDLNGPRSCCAAVSLRGQVDRLSRTPAAIFHPAKVASFPKWKSVLESRTCLKVKISDWRPLFRVGVAGKWGVRMGHHKKVVGRHYT
jgi:hypothetical protein